MLRLVAWVFFFSAIGIAAIPGVDSSGGVATRFDGKPLILVDLVLKGFQTDVPSADAPLTKTAVTTALGFDTYSSSATQAQEQLLSKLKKAGNPDGGVSLPLPLITYLRAKVQSEPRLTYTLRRLRLRPNYPLPPGNENLRETLMPVSTFDPILGPMLDASTWNALGSLSQSALLLREALRPLQVLVGNQLNESNRRDLVASVLLERDFLKPELRAYLTALNLSFKTPVTSPDNNGPDAPKFYLRRYEGHVRLYVLSHDLNQIIPALAEQQQKPLGEVRDLAGQLETLAKDHLERLRKENAVPNEALGFQDLDRGIGKLIDLFIPLDADEHSLSRAQIQLSALAARSTTRWNEATPERSAAAFPRRRTFEEMARWLTRRREAQGQGQRQAAPNLSAPLLEPLELARALRGLEPQPDEKIRAAEQVYRKIFFDYVTQRLALTEDGR